MRSLIALSITLLALISAQGHSQDNIRVGALTPVDRQFMQQQRTNLADIAAIRLGRSFRGVREHDLAVLQTLLDRRIVAADQTEELQAMGIVLGDLLAADLDMHWVVYEDRLGRSRALRYRESDNYLFPVTMISRRREAGSTESVQSIYQKAHDIIAPVRTPLPYQ